MSRNHLGQPLRNRTELDGARALPTSLPYMVCLPNMVHPNWPAPRLGKTVQTIERRTCYCCRYHSVDTKSPLKLDFFRNWTKVSFGGEKPQRNVPSRVSSQCLLRKERLGRVSRALGRGLMFCVGSTQKSSTYCVFLSLKMYYVVARDSIRK